MPGKRIVGMDMKLHPLIENAYKVLDGESLSRDEAIALAHGISGADILDLVSLANKVRIAFAPPDAGNCSIVNAKCGKCGEDCRFCAQSGHYHTNIETFPLLSEEEVVAAARKVYESGVRIFGYVTSGRGWQKPDADFRRILSTLDRLHERFPDLKLCVCLGILSDECARELSLHHVWRYNMNLQTAPARYAELVATTHAIEEKIATIRRMQKYGITNCTGGIFGLGETWEDRVDMAFAIRALKVEASPLNLLLPIPGTPLEAQTPVTPADAAKTFALFRLVNPSMTLKFCAGRETLMKDFQGLLMLSGLNSLMTGGYLTTRGRQVPDDLALCTQLAAFGPSRNAR